MKFIFASFYMEDHEKILAEYNIGHAQNYAPFTVT